ncbi:MAG: type 4a pilus biogenesis protein PilO [Gammaproteobacteria bacterium]|nr:type 4a pilus biogenesis protein PilO [Gammaproteobacteria bacterium]
MTKKELDAFLKDPDALKKIGIAPLPIQIGALVILIIVVLGLCTWKILYPAWQDLKVQEAKEIELRTSFEQKMQKAVNLEAYEQQLDDMRRDFGVMLRQLPDKTEVENLIVDLSQASSANGLKVDNFKPQGEVTKEFYAEYPINMRVFGQYHEIARFVSDVAALPRIVTLHEISLVPVGKDDKNARVGDLKMEMIAKTYHYLDDSK